MWQVSTAGADVRSISIPINPQARSGNNMPILALGSQHQLQASGWTLIPQIQLAEALFTK